jgi:hypothetical protein
MKEYYRFEVTVECDPAVMRERYPNWRFNFRSTRDFARHLASSWAERQLRRYGYRTLVKPLPKGDHVP